MFVQGLIRAEPEQVFEEGFQRAITRAHFALTVLQTTKESEDIFNEKTCKAAHKFIQQFLYSGVHDDEIGG